MASINWNMVVTFHLLLFGTNNGFTVPAHALCHYRFGHASSKLELLCKDFPSVVVNKSLICNICHFARQRKLPFPMSNSRAMVFSNHS